MVNDCQQPCLHFCVNLDHVLEDYSMDKDSSAKLKLFGMNYMYQIVIWNMIHFVYTINQTSETDF